MAAAPQCIPPEVRQRARKHGHAVQIVLLGEAVSILRHPVAQSIVPWGLGIGSDRQERRLSLRRTLSYDKLGLSAAELKTVSESLRNQAPARRFGAPAEIASAVVYLASDESAFTIGSDLIVDGGLGL